MYFKSRATFTQNTSLSGQMRAMWIGSVSNKKTNVTCNLYVKKFLFNQNIIGLKNTNVHKTENTWPQTALINVSLLYFV